MNVPYLNKLITTCVCLSVIAFGLYFLKHMLRHTVCIKRLHLHWQACLCAYPDRIVETAKKFLSSKRWLWKTNLEERAAAQTDKCHLFVGYVLMMSGAPASKR